MHMPARTCFSSKYITVLAPWVRRYFSPWVHVLRLPHPLHFLRPPHPLHMLYPPHPLLVLSPPHRCTSTTPQNPCLANFMCRDTWAILPRLHTHLCRKHQRKVARTIKRARHFAVLPWGDSHRAPSELMPAYLGENDFGYYAFTGYVRRIELGVLPNEEDYPDQVQEVASRAFGSTGARHGHKASAAGDEEAGADEYASDSTASRATQTTVLETDDQYLSEMEELSLESAVAHTAAVAQPRNVEESSIDVTDLFAQLNESERALAERLGLKALF